MSNVIFLSGIDTDAGKTYATAFLAKHFIEQGLNVITQKFIQTGCQAYSEDIEMHRRLLNTPLSQFDLDHTTAPIVFSYPASPQLAAQIDNRTIDLNAIDNATARLAEHFDLVIIEGAGGLMVPISDDFFTIDYITSRHLPLALVTNGILGSINHTILSLEAIAARNIPLQFIIYNTHFDTDKTIADDTLRFIKQYAAKHFPDTQILLMPSIP